MTGIEASRLDTMENKLSAVENKVDRILVALTGDELNDNKGLIKEFNALRERVQKLENLKTKLIYVGIGAGVSCGIFANKLFVWIQSIIKLI